MTISGTSSGKKCGTGVLSVDNASWCVPGFLAGGEYKGCYQGSSRGYYATGVLEADSSSQRVAGAGKLGQVSTGRSWMG